MAHVGLLRRLGLVTLTAFASGLGTAVFAADADPATTARASVAAIAEELFPPEQDREGPQNADLPSPELQRRALERGVLSGVLQLCGAEWQDTSFVPFMRAVRARGDLTLKQISMMSFFHGFAQGRAGQRLTERRSDLCSVPRLEGYRALAGENSF